jgi:pimeloyl-ACP methyl ester carboxylesterase
MARMLIAFVLLLLAPLMPTAALAQSARTEHISIVERGRADAPAVVLIPGLSSPRAVWDGIVPTLERDHRVILVQITGFDAGEAAGANAQPGALDGVVDDIAAYIRDHHAGRPAIIGHSMGGLTALLMAERHPEQTGRVMIVDSLPFIGTLLAPGSTVETIRPMATAMRERARAAPRHADATPPADDPGGIWSITADGRRRVAGWSGAADPAAVAQILYDVMQTDATPGLAAVTAPVTLLYPTSDAVPAAAAQPRYADAYHGLSTLRMVEVPGSYHFIMLDQPQRFADAVAAFLAD